MAVNRLSTQYAYFRWVLVTTISARLRMPCKMCLGILKGNLKRISFWNAYVRVHVIHVADTVQTFLQKYVGFMGE